MRRSRVTCAATLAFLTAASFAAAQGPLPMEPPADPAPVAQDPASACVKQVDEATLSDTTQGAGCDTRYTPVAKEGQELGWTMVSGQVFRDPESGQRVASGDYREARDNQTDPTVDFYTVSFANSQHGLAGGAACQDASTPAEQLDRCVRVPVIYRYGFDDGGILRWSEVYRGNTRGYVGAIAWLSRDRALAVGGTGCYPKREDASLCPAAQRPADSADPVAGNGRVWLATDARHGEFEERQLGGGITQSMTGMTALASTFGLNEKRAAECHASDECAFAGGLRQIWMWRDGAFVARYTNDPYGPGNDVCGPDPADPRDPPAQLCDPSTWRYRVRAIRFAPDPQSGAVAVTAGCCDSSLPGGASDPQKGFPSILGFDARLARWRVADVKPAGQPVPSDQALPDSIYSIVFGAGTSGSSLLFAPGGPRKPVEPASYIAQSPQAALGGYQQLISDDQSEMGGFISGPMLSSLRLVAGDGDLQTHQANSCERIGYLFCGARKTPDNLMDWAVGVLGSIGQGAAYTTTRRGYGGVEPDLPFPVDCPQGGIGGALTAQNPTSCKPADKPADSVSSGAVLSLPTYALNGFVMLAASGEGWAVGDRGAILRLGGSDTASTLEPENRPQLGEKELSPAPDRGAYDSAAPELTHEPGTVPSLASQRMSSSSSPQLISSGTPAASLDQPEGVKAVAMSRDGSEGWAVGPRDSQGLMLGVTTLYHFDGMHWTNCRFHRLEGILSADPACSALRSLRDFNVDGVQIRAIARIPLEYDSDPTNDDQFEAIAAATPAKSVAGSSGQIILVYRQSKWAIDEKTTGAVNPLLPSNPLFDAPITDIAFSSPSDGWIVSQDGKGNQDGRLIYHFDGNEWLPCFGSFASPVTHYEEVNGPQCRDPSDQDPGDGLFPVADGSGPIHLTTAGRRVYLYGTRTANGKSYPVILALDPGPCHDAGDSGCWRAALDPKNTDPNDPATQGVLRSLSVEQGPDGSYTGWGLGDFNPGVTAPGGGVKLHDGPDETALLRAEADGLSWGPAPVDGPAADYLLDPDVNKFFGGAAAGQVVALAGPRGQGAAFVAPGVGRSSDVPMVWFDPATQRWEVFSTPWSQSRGGNFIGETTDVHAIAPDNDGGLWLAVQPHTLEGIWFYRYRPHVRRPVFDEVAQPIREPITGTASEAGGGLWVSTASDTVYRYDRATGWDRMRVPGWDPGRIVTNPSPAYAIAVGSDGRGVVVGKGGRIADISGTGVALDAASGILCSATHNTPPCASGRDLRSAAVAPDGSTLVGGDYLALLWSPPDGQFRTVTPPAAPAFATITGISMPSHDRAWLTTSTGAIFAGSLEGQEWSWSAEARDDVGDTIARDDSNRLLALRAIAIDEAGHGYAVGGSVGNVTQAGDHGIILERTDDGWRRIETEYREDLTSVTLGPNGKGALVGGEGGLVLTLDGGSFAVARQDDFYDPIVYGLGGPLDVHGHPTGDHYTVPHTAEIIGVALTAGYRPGQVEAWAASQTPEPTYPPRPVNAMLHYTSDPAEPLLNGGARAEALPDSAPRSAGEVSFAAFGRSDCRRTGGTNRCAELTGTAQANEVIAQRVRDQILASSEVPDFSIFTGDVSDTGGDRNDYLLRTPLAPSPIHARWTELIARPLAQGGVPVFGAIGGRDLSNTAIADPLNHGETVSARSTGVGTNLAWRAAMAGMPAPWGGGAGPSSRTGVQFVPVGSSVASAEVPDQSVDDPTETIPATEDPTGDVPRVDLPSGLPRDHVGGEKQVGDVGGQEYVGDQIAHTGGAHTHYAFDVERAGEKGMRVVVVDTSLRSLAGADAAQNPAQAQLAWLKDVLSTRPAGERAVVVSNTPTYSYGPGATTDTMIDSTAFEQVLMDNRVDMVVSGRLGWNGRYWAHAPGVHEPCQGGHYQDAPSKDAATMCGAPVADAPDPVAAADELAATAEGLGAPAASEASGALPFVVAASAGGMFGPDGNASGAVGDGFWRGYTVVRISPDGERAPIVEQRPVLDWLGLRAQAHVLRPGQKMTLSGYGREPAGIDVPLRYVEPINTPAVTHRYDLVMADPDKPYVPFEDANGDYVPVPAQVATVDRTAGVIRAGKGRRDRTYAIGILSVGDKAATWPIAFEPRRSFTPARAKVMLPPLPRVARAPAAQPAIRVADAPAPPPPPPATPASPFTATTLQPPQPPALPSLPAAQAPPTPQAPAPPSVPPPPAPPAPPTVPAQQQPLPLALNAKLQAISLVPSVNPPAPPPVNPAPPAGGAARKEAKQRQAAAAKSEEGKDQGAGVDTAESPNSAHGTEMAFSRRDRAKADASSFTAVPRDAQASAWARGALYGGGLGLAALTLAAGFLTLRPRPRRHEPRLPAPAWARRR